MGRRAKLAFIVPQGTPFGALTLAQGRLKNTSRGSPRSFTAQRTLVQDDN
jgi:hypothetical protein